MGFEGILFDPLYVLYVIYPACDGQSNRVGPLQVDKPLFAVGCALRVETDIPVCCCLVRRGELRIEVDVIAVGYGIIAIAIRITQRDIGVDIVQPVAVGEQYRVKCDMGGYVIGG